MGETVVTLCHGQNVSALRGHEKHVMIFPGHIDKDTQDYFAHV